MNSTYHLNSFDLISLRLKLLLHWPAEVRGEVPGSTWLLFKRLDCTGMELGRKNRTRFGSMNRDLPAVWERPERMVTPRPPEECSSMTATWLPWLHPQIENTDARFEVDSRPWCGAGAITWRWKRMIARRFIGRPWKMWLLTPGTGTSGVSQQTLQFLTVTVTYTFFHELFSFMIWQVSPWLKWLECNLHVYVACQEASLV